MRRLQSGDFALLDAGEGPVGQMIRTLGLEATYDCLRRLRLVWISHRHAGEWVLRGRVEESVA